LDNLEQMFMKPILQQVLTIVNDEFATVSAFTATMTPMDFPEWLEKERERFGWSRAELARRADVNPSTLSMIYSHKRGVGVDTCRGLAKALRLPEAEVLRAAGLLAPDRGSDRVIEELLGLAAKLPDDDRQDLIDLARAKFERRERAKKKTSRASS